MSRPDRRWHGHAARLLTLAAILAGCAEAPRRIPTLFTNSLPRDGRGKQPTPTSTATATSTLAPAPADPWRPTPPPPAAPRSAPTPPAARELMLPNGLRVVAVEHHARPVVVMTLLWPRGAFSDPSDAAGATSLAVQIATDYRERSDRGEEDLEEKPLRGLVAELGATLDSGTTHEAAWIHLTGYAADLGAYLTLLAGAVQEPRHGERSFKGRRDAKLDFLEDLRTSDDDALGRVMAQAAFGRGHPYARSPIGTRASLSTLGLEDVVRQQAAVLVPEGATLVVVGDLDARTVLGQAQAAFRGWQGRALPAPVVEAGPAAAAREPVGLLRRQPASTLVTCAARPLAGVTSSDASLQLLAALLGDGAASRLARALREQGGHAYAVGAGLERRRHGRAFLACATLGADRGGEGLKAFRETLAAVRAAPPSASELAHALGQVQAELDASWDDAHHISAAWTEAIALGEDRPRPERRRAELMAVTADELWRAAREVLRPEATRWVVSGETAAAARASEANGLGAPLALTLDR